MRSQWKALRKSIRFSLTCNSSLPSTINGNCSSFVSDVGACASLASEYVHRHGGMKVLYSGAHYGNRKSRDGIALLTLSSFCRLSLAEIETTSYPRLDDCRPPFEANCFVCEPEPNILPFQNRWSQAPSWDRLM